MKDFFSAQSGLYKKYRPVYPKELYDHIVSFVEKRETALDVATGSGQAAVALAGYFKTVFATDISAEQLKHAEPKENIIYRQSAAEATFFKPHTFDLIAVAQAYHWLQHQAFAQEAARIAKPGAVMAVWGYGRFKTGNTALDCLMDAFYFDIVGPYWDEARKDIDNHYAHLPFPYKRLPAKTFFIEAVWTKDQLSGYLNSWSSVQTYMQANGASPLLLIQDDVNRVLGDERIAVQFPIFLHLGRIEAA